MKTIFEKSQKGMACYSLPKEFGDAEPDPSLLRKTHLNLPEISEIDLTRHYVGLSRRTAGIDNMFYPLGSCTMKFNPRICEKIATLSSFSTAHPLAPDFTVQGHLELIYELISFLSELTGMQGGTLLPNAGAQGEFIGVKLIAAYHKSHSDLDRTEFLVPDSAHGTNPATVAMAGFTVKVLKTNKNGHIDLSDLISLLSSRTAGLMLTNPNTLGLFSPNILEIANLVHQKGGLLYYDGANLNPILTMVKPGEMGFDVMHVNLHKTFSTPHGGGGPGSGPVLCNEKLIPFLPVPRVIKKEGKYHSQWKDPKSIGNIAPFYGNFGIYLRAFVYAKLHGLFGLRKIAENAVLNANYLKTHLEKLFTIPFKEPCMHEFVLQADRFLNVGVRAHDIAKRLLDYGVHAPTVYFPQIIKECFLIEPTESESKDTLDQFIYIFEKIVAEIQENPEIVKTAPHNSSIGRLDEIYAAKHPLFIDPLAREKRSS